MPTAITEWDGTQNFSQIETIQDETIQLLNNETIDNIGRGLVREVINQLTGYTYGADNIIILWGIELGGTNPGARTWTEGAIFYEGDIYIVDAGSDTTTGSEVLIFDDTTPAGVHEVKTATLINGTPGSGIAKDIEGLSTTRFKRNTVVNEYTTDKVKIAFVEIGAWDMNASSSVNVVLPSSIDVANIKSISVMIRSDAGALYEIGKRDNISGDLQPTGEVVISGSTITLQRAGNGFFDSTDFNNTLISRGDITIMYI